MFNFMFSCIVLWRSIILRKGGHITETFDLSSLAKVSDGYTPGHMTTVITQVLTERRIQQVTMGLSLACIKLDI